MKLLACQGDTVKSALISLLAGLVLTACASPQPVAVPPEPTATLSSPTQRIYPSILDMQGEFDPGATFGVFRSEPLLERMPGSDLYDIHGGLGLYNRLTPAHRPAHDNSKVQPTITLPSRREASITLDRVDWDIHTLMHYLALRAELQIIVEGDVDQRVGVDFCIGEELTKGKAVEVIQSICKACKLDYVEDGDVIIVKRRSEYPVVACVTAGDKAGLYNVRFEDHELIAAIMEVAVVTKAQVFVPAVPPGEAEEWHGPLEQILISLELKNATADEVLRKLAERGDMMLTVEQEEGGTPRHIFTYKKK